MKGLKMNILAKKYFIRSIVVDAFLSGIKIKKNCTIK